MSTLYHVDRMMQNLKLGGKLRKLKRADCRRDDRHE